MYENHRHLSEVGGDAVLTAIRTTPPVAVTASVLSGMTLDTWVAIATLVYVLLSIVHLIAKWRRDTAGGETGADPDG